MPVLCDYTVIRANEVSIGNNSPVPKDRRLLDDTELNAVAGGGMDLKGASESMTQRAQQNVAEGMFGLGMIY